MPKTTPKHWRMTDVIADYIEDNDGNFHHFALASDFARTISRKEVVEAWNDLHQADLLHLHAISFRRDDLLLNPLWFAGQDGVDGGIKTDTTMCFTVYDNLGVMPDNDLNWPPGKTASLGDVFRMRTDAGDEVIGIASLGRLVRRDGSPVTTEARSHADFIHMIAVEAVNAVGCVVVALATRNTMQRASIIASTPANV